MKKKSTNTVACRLRNNDVDAFNTLYWDHHAALYANAIRIIKDHTMAEDIIQDVFVSLWEKRHMIDPKQDIAGWLFVMSRNKAIDALRKKIRQAIAENIIQPIVEEPFAVKDDISSMQLSNIEKAVEQLSPQKKKVFDLCKVQRCTYEKAAEEMHISKHTVKEYLSEAIISIKKYMGEHSSQAQVIIQIIIASQIFFGA